MRNVMPILLVSFLGCSIVCAAKEHHAPLPAKLLAAKTIYIENHGPAKIADRAYDELQKWGRWKIVDSTGAADIVLQLSGERGEATSGQTSSYDYKTNTWHHGTVTEASSGHTHISIIDPKAGETLYSDTRSAGYKSATRKMLQDLRNRIEEQEKTSAPR
jgi:hypothetical protein